MSVLIKGLKMPADCWCCPCIDAENHECGITRGYVGFLVKSCRLSDCPLVAVPDHGDLIDKNRMVEVLDNGSKNVSEIQKGVKNEKDISYCQGLMIAYANAIVALDGAPVVIPAERSEE